MDYNPYAPPKQDEVTAPPVALPTTVAKQKKRRGRKPRYWREGELLVVEAEAVLPANICLVTGQTATGDQVRPVLTRTSPLVLLLLLTGPLMLPGFIVYWFHFRPRLAIHCGLSKAVRTRQRLGEKLGFEGTMLCGAVLLAGAFADSTALGTVGILGILVCPIVGKRLRRVAPVVWIEDGQAGLRVNPAVFAALGLPR